MQQQRRRRETQSGERQSLVPFGLLGALLLPLLVMSCARAPASDTVTGLRIISTAPSVTQLVYALGAEQQLVGVTSYCDYPPAARSKPRIGSFASPSVEAILAQRPDLVLILADRQDLSTRLGGLGFEVQMLDVRDLDAVLESTQQLADRLGRTEEGRGLVRRLTADVAAHRAAAADRPRRTVLVLVGRNPGGVTDLYAVGSRSYLADLVNAAGGESIFADSPILYPKVSIEEILVRDPEIILDLSQMGEEATPEHLATIAGLWQEYSSLQAVRNGRVFVLTDDVFLVPGPRLGEALQRLSAVFEGLDID